MEIRVLADIIKVSIRMRSHRGRLGPKDNDRSFYKRQKRTQRHREEGHVTEAEMGVTQPPAEECTEPPEAESGKDTFSPRAFGGSMALLTPRFKLLASKTVRKQMSVS